MALMEDREIAALLLNSLSVVDNGCPPCVEAALDEALRRAPDLPWEQAVADVYRPGSRVVLQEAIRRSREWLTEKGVIANG